MVAVLTICPIETEMFKQKIKTKPINWRIAQILPQIKQCKFLRLYSAIEKSTRGLNTLPLTTISRTKLRLRIKTLSVFALRTIL